MTIKKAIVTIILLCCSIINLIGQEEKITFKIIKEYKGSRVSAKPVYLGGYFWGWYKIGSDYGLMGIDGETGEVRHMGLNGYPMSWKEDTLLLLLKKGKDIAKEGVAFNINTEEISQLETGRQIYSSFDRWGETVAHYGDDDFYFGKVTGSYEDMMSEDLYSFNTDTGDSQLLLKNTAPLAVSPDKKLVLLHQKGIYTTETLEPYKTDLSINWGEIYYKYSDISQIGFLTNRLVIANSSRSLSEKIIYDIEGSYKGRFRFYIGGENRVVDYIFFSDDLETALAFYTTDRGQVRFTLLNTAPFKAWLSTQGPAE